MDLPLPLIVACEGMKSALFLVYLFEVVCRLVILWQIWNYYRSYIRSEKILIGGMAYYFISWPHNILPNSMEILSTILII